MMIVVAIMIIASLVRVGHVVNECVPVKIHRYITFTMTMVMMQTFRTKYQFPCYLNLLPM